MFKNKGGKTITVTTNGTPLCDAGLRMSHKGYDKDKKMHVWKCLVNCENGGSCLFLRKGCTSHTFPEDDYRRFSDPPYVTNEYKEVYALRKLGEQIYSQFYQNLSVPMEVKTLDALKVHVTYQISFH